MCVLDLAFHPPFGYQRSIRLELDRRSFGSFEPLFRAALAQLVEHIIRNDGVSSSSLLSGTIKINNLDYYYIRMRQPNIFRVTCGVTEADFAIE